MYKPLADSTLMAMSKKEIIEHLRIAEHNHRVCEEQIDQQYRNCIKLLKEERANAIDELFELMHDIDMDSNLIYLRFDRDTFDIPYIRTKEEFEKWFKEQLKEKIFNEVDNGKYKTEN